jgi:hypothetical protein
MSPAPESFDPLKPLKPADAKQLARDIAMNGTVDFTAHALEEMAKDDLETADCFNLIRAGVYGPPDHIKGEWRYRVETVRICVVIAFDSPTELTVVTAWRKAS